MAALNLEEEKWIVKGSKALLLAGVLLGILSYSVGAGAATFGYFGAIGPDFWADLDPAYAACGEGNLQSPADLGPQRVFPRLAVQYDESTTGEIFNNGHTIEVEITGGENVLTLDGQEYELKQFHFHTASEHRVGGRGFDMELHLVHTSASGENAVLGVFLKRGDSSGALGPVFASMPEIGGELNVKEELDFDFDPELFLPDTAMHYRYLGSLTTPPCTEGVKWVVMLEPVTVLDEDMAQFTARVGFNARYTQRVVPQR